MYRRGAEGLIVTDGGRFGGYLSAERKTDLHLKAARSQVCEVALSDGARSPQAYCLSRLQGPGAL
jgi:hypothetical protein